MSDQTEALTLPYQQVLRAIGARLDGLRARNIHLLEEPDGFTVRYQTEPGKAELRMERISLEELLQQRAEMERHRGDNSGSAIGSYQDFLRALGFELEQRSVYSILVDELDDGFLVTYQYLKPEEGYVFRKNMIVAGTDEKSAILEHAYQRRQRQPQKRSRFL